MRRKITKLMTAFALLVFMAPSMVGWGQSYSLYSGSLVEGDYLIVYQGKAMKNTISSNRLQYQEVTVSNDVITTTSDAIVWHIAPSGNYWTIYNADVAKYAAGNGTKNQATLLTSGTDDGSLWTASGSSTYEFVNKKNADANVNKNLRNNGTYGFACYGTGTGGALSLYKLVETNDPSITASNVSIAYNATEGFISYEINNPTNDGQLSAATDADWITYVSVGTQVHFNCYSNDGLERTATITLTYTYNTNQTVTKDVTVTQAADPDALGAINNPYTVAEARAAIDAGTGVNGVYATGIVSQVTSYNSTYHSITYWISDDGTQTNELEAYGGISGIDGWTFSSTNDIQVGATVVICGNLKKYGDTYEFDLNNQLVSYTAPAVTVATPTFNPNGGTFTEVQSVTISCETEGVDIFYTTDGTDPDDESTPYSGAITVNETTTIKAIAYDGDTPSAIATATYTINLPLPEQTFSQIDGHNPVEGQTYLIVDLTSGRALTSANGSSSSPTAVEVTVTNGQITTNDAALQWTFEATGGGYIIHPLGDNTKWLYTTDANSGVRVGTNDNKVWTLNITDATNTGYLGFKNNATSRYMGVYNAQNTQDWRAYTSVNNNIKDTHIALFVLGDAPAPAPSFTIENNNEIAYNATSGSFNFTVNNSVEGGQSSVSEDVDWISNAAISGNSVTFTTTVNEAATSREGVITLTYTYNRETVTKDVTVTQAGNPNATLMTIAEVRTQGTGNVATKGVVTSFSVNNSNKTTAYIQDATAAIVVYGEFTVAVGDEIRVAGSLSDYNGLLEIINTEVTIISSNNTIDPEVMTIAEINASTNQGWYIRVEEATVTAINGQNTTIAQGDNTIVVRGISGVEYAVNDVLSLNGNIGYYNGNQIAHPQNVEVQQNFEPSITVIPATVNAPFAGAEGTLTVTYEDVISDDAEVYFCDAQAMPATYDWINAGINDEYNVYYSINANQGEARTAYLMVVVGEIASSLVTINQEAYVAPTVATLPFMYDGNGLGELPDGLTQEGLTGKYDNSPKMKFDGTGDWLLLHFDGTPGILTFDIKGNPGSGDWSGTFKVQTSEDGVNYTDLETYTELTNNVQHESFSNLGENVRYIKWIFDTKDNGNVALGNIVLQPYVAPQEYTLTVSGLSNVELYVFDASNENQAIIEGEGSAQVLNGTTIEISVSAIDGYVLESLMVDGENVISQLDETGAYTFTMPDHNVTVTATAIEYVVGNFVRISDLDQLTDGSKVIIAARYDEEITDGYYAMKNTLTNNKATGVEFSSQISGIDEILPASIVDDEDDYYWVVNVTEDGYTFTNANGQMIGYASSTNFNMTGNKSDWTIEESTSDETAMVGNYTGFVITNVDTDTRAFAFNGSVFGAYAKTNMSAAGYNFYLDFFVQTAASETVTQTIELHPGWNWISTYIDMNEVDGMTMLKEALGDKAISIATQNDIADYDDEDGEWYGLEDYELTNAEMVMILVENDCTITLAGPTVDPNTVEITIKPNGWTWIGYPIATETDIETALADFEAEDEDTFADKNGVSDYAEGDGWLGDVTTLVPGHGYMYYSTSDEPKTVYFQMGNAKAKKVVR